MNLLRSVERTKKLKIDPVSDDLVRYHASLVDSSTSPEGTEVIHSLAIEGVISLPGLTILSLEARAFKQPYRECAASLAPLAQIVGMTISAGFSARVKALLGGTAGCSHFLTLVLDVAASHTLTLYLRMRERALLEESDNDNGEWSRAGMSLEPRLENACIALASDKRPIRVAKLKRGA